MRNVIAALGAVSAVVVAVLIGWVMLSGRVAVEPTTATDDVDDVLAVFAARFSDGDHEALDELVHPDDRDDLGRFLTVAQDMTSQLGSIDVAMAIAPARVDNRRASAPITITVTMSAAAPEPTREATPGTTPGATPAPTPSGADQVEPTDVDASATGAPDESAELPATSWGAQLTAVQRRGGWFVTPDVTTLHPGLATASGFARIQIQTPRASILDVHGQALTAHGDLTTLGISPGQVDDREHLLELWGEVLPQTLPDLVELLDRTDLNDDWFYPVASLTQEDFEPAWRRLRTLAGVISRNSSSDGTPTGTSFAHHVLGRVGVPSAEQIEQWDVEPGVPIGLYGLERVLEDRLVGSPTTQVVLADATGDPLDVIDTLQADPSGPVASSLDSDVQEAIENALVGLGQEISVVAVRTDGGIAGVASRPLDGYNRAFEGLYTPGDAVLPITATALVASGRGLDTTIDCPESDRVEGVRTQAPVPLGETSLLAALAAGCDTSLAAATAEMDPEVLLETAASLGLGVGWSLPLPTETGSMPEPEDDTEAVRNGLGGSRVQASPLELATVAASVLSSRSVTPWLLVDDAVAPAPLAVDTTPVHQMMILAAGSGSGTGTVSSAGAGAIAGTAPVTGNDTVHSWVIATVDDLGIAVLVQDTQGDLVLATTIMGRIDRELQIARADN